MVQVHVQISYENLGIDLNWSFSLVITTRKNCCQYILIAILVSWSLQMIFDCDFGRASVCCKLFFFCWCCCLLCEHNWNHWIHTVLFNTLFDSWNRLQNSPGWRQPQIIKSHLSVTVLFSLSLSIIIRSDVSCVFYLLFKRKTAIRNTS